MRLLIVVAILLVARSSGRAQDFQSWNEVDLTASWHKVDFLVPLLARTDSSLPNPQLAATGMTADLPQRWHLTLTAGYLFADLPQKPAHAHVPLVALTPALRFGRLSIADRNRFEKLFAYANQPVRYRNRLLVDEVLGNSRRWHVFVQNEAIWDLTDAAWSQNRLQGGAGSRLDRHFSLDVYYLRRNAAGGAAPVNVLGTTLRVSLTPAR
jgi:hypothetical protein